MACSAGCHSVSFADHEVVALYDRGEAVAALAELDKLSEERGEETDIVALNRSVLLLMAGRPDETVRELEQVRTSLDHLAQPDLFEQTQSALRDDNAVSWSGREFERRMVDSLQLLAAMAGHSDDTLAFATRSMAVVHADELELGLSSVTPDDIEAENSQQEVAPGNFAVNRVAAWLAAAAYSERIQDSDLADRIIHQAAAWQQPADEYLSGMSTLGTRTSRGSGTLQVVTLAGRISGWEAARIEPTSTALLIADRILSATGDHTLPPTVSSVSIARPCQQMSFEPWRTQIVTSDGVTVQGRPLIDLNRTAWDSWLATRDQQIARAVVRRIAKKSTVYTAKDSLQVQKNSGVDLLLNFAGVLWESIEKPDLRYWELLPAIIEVAQVELPAGQHQVTLQTVLADSESKPVINQLQLPVTIEDGNNTFVVCFRPHTRLNVVPAQQDSTERP